MKQYNRVFNFSLKNYALNRPLSHATKKQIKNFGVQAYWKKTHKINYEIYRFFKVIINDTYDAH